QHRAAVAAAGAHPLEDRVGRRGDATALQAVAQLVERRHSPVEPALHLLDRAALARGVELVEDVFLDAGGIGARPVRDAAEQVGRCRTCAGRRCMEHLDEEPNVLRTLQDDVFAAHGSHFHEVTPGYTSAVRPWCPMPTVSATQLCTSLLRSTVSPPSPGR